MTLLLTQGNALQIPLADESVHCVVTSPPYWGLRSYSGEQSQVWGGDPDCAHEWEEHFKPPSGGRNLPDNMPNTGGNYTQQIVENPSRDGVHSQFCVHCGAWYGELGLEPTPEEYVANMVEVFREVRRVLRDDGTLWLNLGDSYAASNPCDRRNIVGNGSPDEKMQRKSRLVGGLKNKDLVGIPWRVAFALQADGWWLRQDIIWHKPNPMPESVTDRCTKAHEYIFLLSKSAKYFWDAEAIAEPAAYAGQDRGGSTNRYAQNAAGMDNRQYARRNKRSVWTVNPQPFPGAHFATFPPKLIEPCIKAGAKPGDTVLDPFTGAGTTAVVAQSLGCHFVGAELNDEYIDLAAKRLGQEVFAFEEAI